MASSRDLTQWTALPRPDRAPLIGRHVRLAPLTTAWAAQLYEAAQGEGSDPDLWNYLGYGPFDSLAAFSTHIADQSASDDPLFFAVIDTDRKVAMGVVAYMRMDPANGVIEIGHIWFGGRLQRSRAATEAIFLLARHVLDDLGYRRLEWKCDNANARSKRAATRFGFTFEGIFRQHMVTKGRNRDTAWFSIIDGEWPAIRAGFEQWLADENFTADGEQKRSLAELREATG